MNPFDGKSPADLLAMVPSLSDPELDALCAVVCYGEYQYIHPHPTGASLDWYFYADGMAACGIVPRFTSQIQDSLALLLCRKSTDLGGVYISRPLSSSSVASLFCSSNPCRAIAEAAATCELTRMIEGDGE